MKKLSLRGVPTKDRNGNKLTREQRIAIKKGEITRDEITFENSCEGVAAAAEENLTEEERVAKINRQFKAIDQLTELTVNGINRSMIVSGPGGLGKTYGVEQVANRIAENSNKIVTIVKGHMRPTGLYILLWENRFKNNVLIIDDCDSVFDDETSFNLLKGALDTSEKRIISWRSRTILVDADGESVDREFEFEGSIIFITNRDFVGATQKNNKFAPHFEALMSRSLYIDTAMRSIDDYVARIKDVILNHGMLQRAGLTLFQQQLVMDYIVENKDRMRFLNLREAIKLGALVQGGDNWRDLADLTLLSR